MARKPLPMLALLVLALAITPGHSAPSKKKAAPPVPQIVDPSGDTMDVDSNTKGDWGDITGVLFSSVKDKRGKLNGFQVTVMTVGDTSKYVNGARFRVQWNLDSKTASCQGIVTMIFGGTFPIHTSDVVPGQWTGQIQFDCEPFQGQPKDPTAGSGSVNVSHNGTWTWAQIPLSTFARTTAAKEYHAGAKFVAQNAGSWRQNLLGYGTLETTDQAPDVCSYHIGSCWSKGPPPKMEPDPKAPTPFVLGR